MRHYRYPGKSHWTAICDRPQISREKLFPEVRRILEKVRIGGDAALRHYAKRFDGADVADIRCTPEAIAASEKHVPDRLKADIRRAIRNISQFHASQRLETAPVETAPGVRCWREARPVEKVGLYVPGGTAPLFSSVLMLGIPAVLAGCQEIVLCSPPRRDGSLHPAILWAAKETGIKTICKAGGAQAIAAMAYGTASVPKVYKLFGPGNQYVTAAKLLAAAEGTAIDMPAGPSEVLVIADAEADPVFIAADLLSQAEHGADSQVLLVTTDGNMPQRVEEEIQRQLPGLPRAEIAAKALEHGAAVVLKTLDECVAFSNHYAPEHLIIQTIDAEKLTGKVSSAGSVFLGPYTPESAGDYASGTNHTLPTNAYARNYSGVSLDSYMKMITFQKISEKGLRGIGPSVENMADAEGMRAHQLAVTRRLRSINPEGK